MIKLRKILLCNYLFYFLLILIIIITLFRVNIKHKSIYNKSTKKLVGLVNSINIDGNKLIMKVSSKENVITTYYFKIKSEKEFFIKHISLGDKILIHGEFIIPKKNTTEGLFNYKDYLKRQEINYLVNVDKIYLLEKNKNILYYIRNKIIKKSNNPYIETFILGDNSSLNSNVLSSYRDIGISHLFALSGMHITLLSSLLLKLLKKIRVGEVKSYFIVGIILMFYMLLTGCSPSILRAVLFFILFSINKIYYFYIKSTNIFIVTIFLSLLINPYFIFEISFQYSFSISLFLIILGDYINTYSNYFSKLFMTSLISFVVSIPISLYNFNQLNILSIIYNLFYVPLISIIVFPLSILSFFIPILSNVLNVFTKLLEISSNIFNKVSFSKFVFCDVNILFYIIYIILIIIFFSALKKNKKTLTLFLIVFLLIHYFIPIFDKSDFIAFIDVGQGDSILIHSNNKNVLIDTGGIMSYSNKLWEKKANKYSIVKSVTIPYLKKLGIKRLDYLILTHGDFDHLGEATKLINNFKIGKILINSSNINYLEKEVIKSFPNVEKVYRNYYFNIGDASFLQLNTNFSDENDNSLVFLCIINDKKILLMGDASIKSEKYIMKHYNIKNIDILKLGHHGSRTSTSETFLKSVNPKLGIISVGLNNKFNHPHKEVISLLNKYNIKYLKTSEYGTIKIYL